MKPRAKQKTRTRNIVPPKRQSYELFESQKSKSAKEADKKAKKKKKAAELLAKKIGQMDPTLKTLLNSSDSD